MDSSECILTNGKIFVLHYVDNFLALAQKQYTTELHTFKENIMKTFKMQECTSDKFLGIRIIRNRSTQRLWLTRDIYIDNIASRFNLEMPQIKIKTSLPDNYPCAMPEKYQATAKKVHQYQQKVEIINHAAVYTWPNIAKTHSLLSERLLNSTDYNIEAANQVI